jgi:UDP-2,4-diacetamido-2,4,6-trideoxy-beta-L-altropyranose hydrolase
MRVLFRTDASEVIGSGHVMRCLALADALRDAGSAVEFVSHDSGAGLNDVVQAGGFAVHQTIEAVGEKRFDWIVVDHYELGAQWERSARAIAERILVVDDLANREHECDLLLDQNFSLSERRYAGLVPRDCELLLGPRYALLRREFREARASLRPRDGRVRRMLVYFGNVDSGGATALAIEALLHLGRSDLRADVVVGRANPWARQLRERYARADAITLHFGGCDMVAMMLRADLAIGAGGVTTWERCCLGLPSVVIALSPNQLPGSRDLGREGYVQYLGAQDDVSPSALADALGALVSDPASVRALSERTATLVDGNGAQRVAQRMLASGITLRPAREEDCAPMIAWRNAPEVLAGSTDPRPIALPAHQRWFAQKLADPNCALLIAELQGRPLGVLRYDIEGEEARASVFLVPGAAGRGYGRQLLREGTGWLKRNHPAVARIVAHILDGNEASRQAFVAAGYSGAAGTYRKELR